MEEEKKILNFYIVVYIFNSISFEYIKYLTKSRFMTIIS